MKVSFAIASLISIGISVTFLVLLMLFESAFAGMSPGVERLITFLLLVLPAGIGAGFGIMSLARKEGRMRLADRIHQDRQEPRQALPEARRL